MAKRTKEPRAGAWVEEHVFQVFAKTRRTPLTCIAACSCPKRAVRFAKREVNRRSKPWTRIYVKEVICQHWDPARFPNAPGRVYRRPEGAVST